MDQTQRMKQSRSNHLVDVSDKPRKKTKAAAPPEITVPTNSNHPCTPGDDTGAFDSDGIFSNANLDMDTAQPIYSEFLSSNDTTTSSKRKVMF